MSLEFSLNISGPKADDFASIRLPPAWDLSFGEESLDFSQLTFKWDFFYSYVFAKTNDMILEVRPYNALLNIIIYMYVYIRLCWKRLSRSIRRRPITQTN